MYDLTRPFALHSSKLTGNNLSDIMFVMKTGEIVARVVKDCIDTREWCQYNCKDYETRWHYAKKLPEDLWFTLDAIIPEDFVKNCSHYIK